MYRLKYAAGLAGSLLLLILLTMLLSANAYAAEAGNTGGSGTNSAAQPDSGSVSQTDAQLLVFDDATAFSLIGAATEQTKTTQMTEQTAQESQAAEQTAGQAAGDHQTAQNQNTSDNAVQSGSAETASANAETAQNAAAQEAASNAAPAPVSLGVFRLTGYCPCYSCSEGYGANTSTGQIAQPNHTIAVDPRVIPYGTRVLINGCEYVAEDRGGAIKNKRIDIFFSNHSQARTFGVQYAEVFLLP